LNTGKRIRVLIVDDSALVRRVLTEVLRGHAAIEVVGAASDAHMAREKIKQLNPDVLTLDVEMPKMDGLTFLRNIMRLRPMPVIMVSSLTEHGADVTLDALEVGAVDYLPKPKVDLAATLADYGDELAGKIKAAAAARLQPVARRAANPPPAAGSTLPGGTVPRYDTGSTSAPHSPPAAATRRRKRFPTYSIRRSSGTWRSAHTISARRGARTSISSAGSRTTNCAGDRIGVVMMRC